MKNRQFAIFFIGCSLVGAMLACGAPTQLVTINLNEQRLDQVLVEDAESLQGEGWAFTYDNVELQEEWLRLHGTFMENDNPAVSGYLDIRLFENDGSLESELVDENFGDVHPSEVNLQSLVESVESAIEAAIADDLQAVRYILVEMLDDLVKIQIRFLPASSS